MENENKKGFNDYIVHDTYIECWEYILKMIQTFYSRLELQNIVSDIDVNLVKVTENMTENTIWSQWSGGVIDGG